MLQRLPQVLERIDAIEALLAGMSGSHASAAGRRPAFEGLLDGMLAAGADSAASAANVTSGAVRSGGGHAFDAIIERAARREGLSADLLHAVIRAESNYDPRCRSSAGAMGLMQLMPGTAQGLGVTDPWDPEQNVFGGARYLRRQIDRFGDLELALAAYNAGPGAVTRHGGIPPFRETQTYVRRVIGFMQERAEAAGTDALMPGADANRDTTPTQAVQLNAMVDPAAVASAVKGVPGVVAGSGSADAGDAKVPEATGKIASIGAPEPRQSAVTRERLPAEASNLASTRNSADATNPASTLAMGEERTPASATPAPVTQRLEIAQASRAEPEVTQSGPADRKTSGAIPGASNRAVAYDQPTVATAATTRGGDECAPPTPGPAVTAEFRRALRTARPEIAQSFGARGEVTQRAARADLRHAQAPEVAPPETTHPMDVAGWRPRVREAEQKSPAGDVTPRSSGEVAVGSERLSNEAQPRGEVMNRSGTSRSPDAARGAPAAEAVAQTPLAGVSAAPTGDLPTVTIRGAVDGEVGARLHLDAARLSGAQLSQGRSERLLLEVDPPRLGRCELELTMRDGELRATIIAERPETVATMRAVRAQIRVQLAEQGLDVTQFDVRGGSEQGIGDDAGGRRYRAQTPPPPQTPRYLREQTPETDLRRTLVDAGHSRTVDLVA